MCATDWENYAEQMLSVLSAERLLQNTAVDFMRRALPTGQPTGCPSSADCALGTACGIWYSAKSRQVQCNRNMTGRINLREVLPGSRPIA